jgi:hypothetical protein
MLIARRPTDLAYAPTGPFLWGDKTSGDGCGVDRSKMLCVALEIRKILMRQNCNFGGLLPDNKQSCSFTVDSFRIVVQRHPFLGRPAARARPFRDTVSKAA